MAGIINDTLMFIGFKNPSYSNAAAAKKAEEERVDNAHPNNFPELANPNAAANQVPGSVDGGGHRRPHNLQEPTQQFLARNLKALAGHSIHQLVATYLTRVAGEYTQFAVAENTHHHPHATAWAQGAILVLDLARVTHMLKKTIFTQNQTIQRAGDLAYAGMSDFNDDRQAQAKARNGRVWTSMIAGGSLLVNDAIALAATVLSIHNPQNSDLRKFAAGVAGLQARSVVYTNTRDLMQTVFTMVGGGEDSIAFHHLTPHRIIYGMEQAGIGMAMDAVSQTFDPSGTIHPNKHAYIHTRAILNYIPEIFDWFSLQYTAGNLAAQHEGIKDLQHWEPGIEKALCQALIGKGPYTPDVGYAGTTGELMKFLNKAGHKFTDQSVVRNSLVFSFGMIGKGLYATMGDNPRLQHLSPEQNTWVQSFIGNAFIGLLTALTYPRINAAWQGQGAQRTLLLKGETDQDNDMFNPAAHRQDLEGGLGEGIRRRRRSRSNSSTPQLSRFANASTYVTETPSNLISPPHSGRHSEGAQSVERPHPPTPVRLSRVVADMIDNDPTLRDRRRTSSTSNDLDGNSQSDLRNMEQAEENRSANGNVSQRLRDIRVSVHQPTVNGGNRAAGAQSTTATASTSAAANTNATAEQRLKYLGNQLWQRTAGALLIANSTTAVQLLTLKMTSNLPFASFTGGMTSSLMKAYPLKALENIGPSLKFPSASQGSLYSKQEFIAKVADGLLDAGLYMIAATITGTAKNAINQFANTHGQGGKLDDAAYAEFLRSHPQTLLAINATTAGADFAHYMLTAAVTACTPAVKYQLKSVANQMADFKKHMKVWTNTDQALKSNTEFAVRSVVAAFGTAWIPLTSKLFPNASKKADFAQSSPLKAAAGGVLRLGQGIAKDYAFQSAKKLRDRPSRNAVQPETDLENQNRTTLQDLLENNNRQSSERSAVRVVENLMPDQSSSTLEVDQTSRMKTEDRQLETASESPILSPTPSERLNADALATLAQIDEEFHDASDKALPRSAG